MNSDKVLRTKMDAQSITNLGKLGVTYENINWSEIDGRTETLINAQGLYQFASSARTAKARKLKAAIDKLVREYERSLPHLSEEKRLEKAIMGAFAVIGARVVSVGTYP